jgi:GDP-L-fucose synthase
MVGQAVQRRNHETRTGWTIEAPNSHELDCADPVSVQNWFAGRNYDLVVMAAAKVGGIKANMEDQVGFLWKNMMIGMNVVKAAHDHNVPKLINLGSSCMYPRDYRQPLVEEDIFAAPFEPTNEGYAIAKTATAKLCEYMAKQNGRDYRTLIPCNLFGPADRYDPDHGHLLAHIIMKTHAAKVQNKPSIEIWGTGEVLREFLYVDDLADAILMFGRNPAALPHYLNVGSGIDHSINTYYATAASVFGYAGTFTHDTGKPNGMTRKLMDSSKARALGWSPKTSLEEGFSRAYAWYLEHYA